MAISNCRKLKRLMPTLIGILLALSLGPDSAAARPDTLSVSVSRFRVAPGDTVDIRVQLRGTNGTNREQVQAVLLKPSRGVEPLSLSQVGSEPGLYRAQIRFGSDDAAGLYAVHVWTGPQRQPRAVGKATVLLGRIVADFALPGYIDGDRPAADLKRYLDEFQAFGGNLLVAHGLITGKKAYYASRVVQTDVQPGSPDDLVEAMLREADRRGISVLLSVSWDLTRKTPYGDRMRQIRSIMKEMYSLYRHHPSLVGFYSYQEGSGTYYVPFIREFSRFAKSLNPNLLTACAPYVDDPLLAGYLSTVESLDIIIYQGMVMASYRSDNQKMYPLRRVRDFVSLGIGAAKLQNKISLTHVELFGYDQHRLAPDIPATTYDNIYGQILSAATAAGADGIALFTYHAHIFAPAKKHPQVERSRAAVRDGLKAFRLITSEISIEPNHLALYVPYSDWVIERWPNDYLPALDAFRTMGIPVDVLPYAPPVDESLLPYYPFHLNKDVLARLLKQRTVLILPNVSGFQQTDSDLIKAFVDAGGAVVAFGPQIPTGRSYDRRELFGGEEADTKTRTALTVRRAIGDRVPSGSRRTLDGLRLRAWRVTDGKAVATFEDGSAAVVTHRPGKGVTIAILPDAQTAARYIPDLVRDAIDYALQSMGVTRPVDILGTNADVDLAVRTLPRGFRVGVVNHNPVELPIRLKPLGRLAAVLLQWRDLATGQDIGQSQPNQALSIRIPAGGFRALECREKPAR